MKPGNRITISQSQRLALNGQLLTSLKILRFDAAGLSRYLEEQAEANPNLRLDLPAPREWLPRWQTAFSADGPQVEDVAGATPSLVSHVLQQIGAMRLSPQEAALAEVLVLAMKPSGWLGQPLEELALMVGATPDEAETLLARLQRLDPPGLFARSLAECLTVQAEEAGFLNQPMRLLLGNLPLIAQGNVARTAAALHLTEAEVTTHLRLLRALDPKPGARFEGVSAPVREPDLIARRSVTGEWQIELNRSALPTLTLTDFHAEGRQAANALIRLVEGRNATLLMVGRALLTHQSMALEKGHSALVPMTMTTIAEELGLSQSTISRAVAGVAVDTPLGTWWLRGLFGAAVGLDGVSGPALRDRLRRMIRAEDPANPLTDDAIVRALAEEGVDLARRTVAKYRNFLALPPAHRRKQRSQGPAPYGKPDRKGRSGG